jgi:hypothetical protein
MGFPLWVKILSSNFCNECFKKTNIYLTKEDHRAKFRLNMSSDETFGLAEKDDLNILTSFYSRCNSKLCFVSLLVFLDYLMIVSAAQVI